MKSGKAQIDVWNILPINQVAQERLGWPTQKPEKLLERIILASSNEDDTVFDAFCGCGTTVAVAERLKRRWIGVDITYQSISVILKRFEDTYGQEVLENIEIKGIPQDIEAARALAENKNDRTRKEFEKWAILTYSSGRAIINEKKGKDYGIDGISYVFGGGNKGKLLFSVKSGHVNSAQIRDFRGTIEREAAVGGVFITLKKPTKDMREEAVKAGAIDESYSAQKHNKIEIVTVQEIIDGERLNMPIFEVVKSAKRHEKKQGTQLKFA
jgi:site-specific DNA-methyltransferase (adenine-specific)